MSQHNLHPTPESSRSASTKGQLTLVYLLRLWFGFRLPVSRRAYALSGVSLMALKYAMDALMVYAFAGRFFSPFDYLSPLLLSRQGVLHPAPDWALWAMELWTVPFLWIGVSMSSRRALDAGFSPWVGTVLFFVPVLNYVMMLALCFYPSVPYERQRPADVATAATDKIKSALLGIVSGITLALLMMLVNVYLLASYGLALFLGTPFLIGAVSTYIYNYREPRSSGSTVAVAMLSVVLSGGAILLFALEGLLCIAMAAPFAIVLGLLGGLLGASAASWRGRQPARIMPALLLLPLLIGVDRTATELPLNEVVSTIEIEAPPEKVWPNVVGFSELSAPEEWYFRAGVAYPMRARIDGAGAGAVRYCEFSTGPFVEPITQYEAPHRLAFDVSAQPPTMHEWSPYHQVSPPHLEGTLRSKRGEFRLIALPGGRTRLEGHTWYELEMQPQAYWTIWSNMLIHRIHRRVLAHIKQLSER